MTKLGIMMLAIIGYAVYYNLAYAAVQTKDYPHCQEKVFGLVVSRQENTLFSTTILSDPQTVIICDSAADYPPSHVISIEKKHGKSLN